jgi:hypothetical protein
MSLAGSGGLSSIRRRTGYMPFEGTLDVDLDRTVGATCRPVQSTLMVRRMSLKGFPAMTVPVRQSRKERSAKRRKWCECIRFAGT